MNLEELRTFLAIVETGSLVAASRRLYVTQSTVTARMNALEEEIGQKLLHRVKSGAELTSPGFKFKRYAEVMVQLWRQACHEIALPEGFSGVCNVGLEFDLWPDVGRRLLQYMQLNCPGIAVALWPGGQVELDRWLRTGLVDLAFGFTPQASEQFASRVLFVDEIVLVATHGKTASAAAGGSGEGGYVFVDHGDEFRRQHAEAFPVKTAGVTIACSEWAIDHLLKNGGSGYLPRRLVRELLESGQWTRVDDAPVFGRRVYVVETTQTVRPWEWYEGAIAAISEH